MKARDCPVCCAPTRRLFERHGFWIRACATCGHRFVEYEAPPQHAAETYGDEYFEGGGAGYPDYLAEARILRARGRWYGRLLEGFAPPGSVLDVGAAAGFWLQGMTDAGWRGAGVEVNARMATHARERLGLEIKNVALENWSAGDRRFDLLAMIQVVAHFYDLERAFRVAAAATKPNGLWLVETWNAGSFTARCLGRRWHEYSPPSVLHMFTVGSLERLAASHGFRPIALGRPPKCIGARHAKSLLRYKLGESAPARFASRMLDLVPDQLTLRYPAEDLFWELFRRE